MRPSEARAPKVPLGVTVVAPQSLDLSQLFEERVLKPFADPAIAFAAALSQSIMLSSHFRQHTDAIAFAYWARSSRLKQLKKEFYNIENTGLLVARGTAFHIAPANVDTIFLYSLMISLLGGNKNIVRISSRNTAQMDALVGLLDSLLNNPAHSAMRTRLAIIRYEHNPTITQYFSNFCDLRVVWGGDATVNAIREISLPPRAVEVCFPDKVSIAVFDVRTYLNWTAKADFAKAFRNDSYWFGQMACSSPRAIIWLGSVEDAREAAAIFWAKLDVELKKATPELSAMDYLNKLLAEQSFMVQLNGSIYQTADNQSTVVDIKSIADIPFDEHCGGGLFLQTRISELVELAPYLSRRYQTVLSLGIEKEAWQNFISTEQPAGIDRIVPVGMALSFNTVWDGMSLFRSFTREITIQP
jgi:Acyl-CoA reductase (LuxC)